MSEMLEELKEEVAAANLALVEEGLVLETWGNASAILRSEGLVVIKPSGMPYEDLEADDLVTLDLDGNIVDGELRPSSDTPTHLALYRAFPEIGSVVHTHSHFATSWAQAGKPIPCFGTTHADYFHGAVPVTEALTKEEVAEDYEANTGAVIVRRFQELDPKTLRAVLVAQHGPFTWGATVDDAVDAAVALEEVAAMALHTLQIAPDLKPVPDYLLDKHFQRKHGTDAYYGQDE